MIPPSTLYGLILTVVVVAAGVTLVLAPTQAAISIPLFSMVALGVLTLLQNAAAAVKVAEVAAKQDASSQKTDALVVAVDETREVAKSTHLLVNNQTMVQLELTAELSRWKAEREPTAANVAAAEKADRMLADHMAAQAASDRSIPRAGFGAMPDQPAEAAPVSVETMSPEAARAIADAVRPDIAGAVSDAVSDATTEQRP